MLLYQLQNDVTIPSIPSLNINGEILPVLISFPTSTGFEFLLTLIVICGLSLYIGILCFTINALPEFDSEIPITSTEIFVFNNNSKSGGINFSLPRYFNVTWAFLSRLILLTSLNFFLAYLLKNIPIYIGYPSFIHCFDI